MATPVSADVSAVVRASNAFAFAVYKELVKTEEDKNFFFSPMSITAALAMTHLGATGNTADEIKSALYAKDITDEDFHSAFSVLNAKLNSAEDSECILRMANRIFPAKNFPVKKAFKTATKKHYAATARVLDFETDCENSRKRINKWVVNQTEQMIQELLPQGILNESTVMVLVNAIYFNGVWLEPFDPAFTKKDNWTLSSNETTEADIMYDNNDSRYKLSILQGAAYAEIPYKGEELSLGVVLPKKIEDLGAVQDNLDVGTYEKMIGEAKIRDMDVYLPKFWILTSARLNQILGSLGISSAFDPGGADFSNMTDGSVYVSEVIHKAFVEVNEVGTEAAAATAVIEIGLGLMDSDTFIFKATHPFIFFIKDNTTGAILFMGRLMNPNEYLTTL